MSKVALSFVFDRKNTIKTPLEKGAIELKYYLHAVANYHTTKIKVFQNQWHEVKKM